MTDTDIFFDAIQGGDHTIVERLIAETPALVNAKKDGLSAVLTAAYTQNPDIVDLLVLRGAQLNIFEAAAAGSLDQVKALITQSGERVNAYAQDGFQPLGLAAFFGHADVAEYLIEHGAEVNSASRNPMHVMPLHSAAAGQHLDIVRVLLDNEADPNLPQAESFTALHAAAQNGDLDMARLLLAYGADPQVRTSDGRTPLALAKEVEALEIIDLLTEFPS